MRRFLVLKNYRDTLTIQDDVYKTAKTQSKRDVIIIDVIIWLTINVINFNHKCNKYRNWYESEFVSIFMETSSV